MATSPISTRVPQENYIELKKIAQDTGQTVSDLVNEAIARYLGRAGAGARVSSRLDRLEAQVNKLTLMAFQPQGTRAEQATAYLEMIHK